MSEQLDGAVEEREINSIEDILAEVNGEPIPSQEPAEEADVEGSEEDAPANADEPSSGTPDENAESSEDSSSEAAKDGNDEVVFEPNLSYSVLGEEKTFDERLSSIIKTKEDEDFIRELVTKSAGLDGYKEKLTVEEEARTEVESALTESQDALETMQGFYQEMVDNKHSNNWRGVTKSLGYSDDDILKMAIEIADERALPQAQRAQASQSRELAEQNRMLQAQQQILAQQQQAYQTQLSGIDEQAANARAADEQTQEINGLIESTYSSLSGAMASSGLNMFDEVVALGASEFRASNGTAVPSVTELMNKVSAKYGFMLNAAQAAEEPTPRKETIPTIGGNNNSQIASEVTSMDDLLKIQRELNKANY